MTVYNSRPRDIERIIGEPSMRRVIAIGPNQVVHNPRQITDVSQLHPGKFYQDVHLNEQGREMKSPPRKLLRVDDGKAIFQSREHESVLYLSDMGVIPYAVRSWNIVNYLIEAAPVETEKS